MDNKAFLSRVTTRMGETAPVIHMAQVLADALRQAAADLDMVAVPGFGNFSGVKRDEYVADDPATGRRTIYPPRIEVEFRPSVLLRKRLNQK